jgi:hypothetical protein
LSLSTEHILNALTLKCDPNPRDVIELLRIASRLAATQLDVPAWEVIQQAMMWRDAIAAGNSRLLV